MPHCELFDFFSIMPYRYCLLIIKISILLCKRSWAKYRYSAKLKLSGGDRGLCSEAHTRNCIIPRNCSHARKVNGPVRMHLSFSLFLLLRRRDVRSRSAHWRVQPYSNPSSSRFSEGIKSTERKLKSNSADIRIDHLER